MAPTSSIAASQLHQLIYYHIDNELLDTANFLAGRLHALEPRNPDSAHLLALTYYRQRRYKAAFDFSQRYGASGRHLGCAYVFALACLELGRNTEGTTALEKAKNLWNHGKMNWKKHSETTRRHLPDAPAVWTLQAKLWRAHGDYKKAGDCYLEAHKANPFTWDAFEGLCKIGADLKLENMFKPPADGPSPQIYTDEAPSHGHPLAPQVNFNQQVLTPSSDPFNARSEGASFVLPNLKTKSSYGSGLKQPLSEWDTPVANSGSNDDDVMMGGVQLENEDVVAEPPPAPARRTRPGQNSEASDRPRQPTLRRHGHPSSEGLSEQDSRRAGGHKRTISGHASQASSVAPSSDPSAAPRRSNRLFGQTGTARTTRSTTETTSAASRVDRTVRTAKPATGAKGRLGSTVGRVVSGNRKIMPPDPADKGKEKERRAPSRAATTTTVQQKPPPPSTTAVPDLQAETQAMTTLLDSFRNLAVGYYSASRFDLPKALTTFRNLPSAQRETPWALAQLAKTQHEMGAYPAAAESFARLLRVQPSRVEDMEVYSTTLWHLKDATGLAFLAHTLRSQSFSGPQTWCAVGNAFSLSRSHEEAISAFQRATQLDEKFAYAWTLMGHEYIANESFDLALSSFRKSVSIDRRNWGGWYGLGKTYERLGKLEAAEQHYRLASSINPSNATLLVCIGVVLERMRNKPGALANYTKALELGSTSGHHGGGSSALARFKKARVLMHMRQYPEALEELSILKDQAPDEANVWFLLGKCLKGLGRKGEALRSLTTALNLDVKVCSVFHFLFFFLCCAASLRCALPSAVRPAVGRWRGGTVFGNFDADASFSYQAAPFIKEAMEALDDEEDVEESDED
jgi:anaphase-promoting complex subunit 3